MDDPRVIEAFRAAKPEAFEAIVDLHGDRLFRSAVLLGGSEQVAEDLVQETFLRAFRAASTFRGQSGLFTWLYGILLNVNRNRSRTIFRLIFTDQVPEREAQAPIGPASATVACLLIGSFGGVRLLTPPAAHASSYIKCVSVVYADEARADWSKRTVMVRMKNGTESYINIVATRPRATKGKPL